MTEYLDNQFHNKTRINNNNYKNTFHKVLSRVNKIRVTPVPDLFLHLSLQVQVQLCLSSFKIANGSILLAMNWSYFSNTPVLHDLIFLTFSFDRRGSLSLGCFLFSCVRGKKGFLLSLKETKIYN